MWRAGLQKIKMIAWGCGSLALALTASHFLQSTSAIAGDTRGAARAASVDADANDVAISEASHLLANARLSDLPDLPKEPHARAGPLDAAGIVAGVGARPSGAPEQNVACTYTLTADAAPEAMAALTLDAPCAAGRRFTLHHNGIMFTEVTDKDGRADMQVPALSRQATFIAAFSGGEGAVAGVDINDIGAYQRVAMQWQGAAGMRLHAVAFGADGEPQVHEWSGGATGDEAGVLTRLGNADQPGALLAEVYTFPSGPADRNGTIALRVEAEITDGNCDRDIDAQTLQMQADGGLRAQNLTLMMPGCEAVGDFLVLNNLLNDITIARN